VRQEKRTPERYDLEEPRGRNGRPDVVSINFRDGDSSAGGRGKEVYLPGRLQRAKRENLSLNRKGEGRTGR